MPHAAWVHDIINMGRGRIWKCVFLLYFNFILKIRIRDLWNSANSSSLEVINQGQNDGNLQKQHRLTNTPMRHDRDLTDSRAGREAGGCINTPKLKAITLI